MKYESLRRFKPFFKQLTTGPMRWFVLIFYRPVIFVELQIEKALDSKTRYTDKRLQRVTAVIKTFERPAKLKILVKSIQRTHPELKIIVVDDSKRPSNLKGVKTITLAYDSGVSAGRAIGLASVETEFVLNLDDDFVFNRHTHIDDSIDFLDSHQDVDIVGGEVIYLPFYYKHNYENIKLIGRYDVARKNQQQYVGGLEVMDKTANFFLARTEKVREVGWDEKLKRLDHGDFFTRAKGKLATVFNPSMIVLHLPSYFNRKYIERKHDTAHDSRVLWMRYGRK